ncbi:hypothetical protein V1264_013049 [Littorina saxatilis]|uniref:Uncharacterized protein n=1 Tax=Littorina saxatilis TaxID=31220 RepID=A0AAN9BSL9_9CAEN
MSADDVLGAKDAVVYVMPQRIQKKMLQDIKHGVKRTNLKLREKFGYWLCSFKGNLVDSHTVTVFGTSRVVSVELGRSCDGARMCNGAFPPTTRFALWHARGTLIRHGLPHRPCIVVICSSLLDK